MLVVPYVDPVVVLGVVLISIGVPVRMAWNASDGALEPGSHQRHRPAGNGESWMRVLLPCQFGNAFIRVVAARPAAAGVGTRRSTNRLLTRRIKPTG